MFKGLLFFIRCGLKYDKLYIVWRVLYQLIHSLVPIVATLMPKFILDELLGPMRPQRLLLYAGILTGYAALAAALSAFFDRDSFTRRCRVNAEFDSDLHRRLADTDLENLESPDFLDLRKKAEKFLYCDWHGFAYLLDCALNTAGQMVTFAGLSAVMLTLHPLILLLFAALALAGAVVEGRARTDAMRLSLQISADQRGWMYYSQLFGDAAFGKEIRIGRLGRWLAQRERQYFTRVNQNIKAQNDGYIRAGAIGALFMLVEQGVAYAYLFFGVYSGRLSIGSFAMYSAAITAFASALRCMLESVMEIRAYDLYYENLDAYLKAPARLREGANRPLPAGNHRIEFKNVGFRYRGAQTWALRGIDFTLMPGEKLSVVGENGAGKTTFIKLLMRLYDPTEGQILLDGTDIREIDYDAYLSLFSAVFQDYKLFPFSLLDNVILSQPRDEQRAERILRDVGLGGKLDHLPRGTDTSVSRQFDPLGFEPSGGEGQKLALARALYKDAPIVVLDEPTAALDPRAEFDLYRRFDSLVSGKTAVYISHRLSSARFCDRIAVFDGGRIVEAGTHRDLMQRRGKYAELFTLQAQFYVETDAR